MADLVLVNQLPSGWLDDKEEERFRLEIGDLVNLLSSRLRKRWRFNLMTKKIELDGKPIPVFELENLYCQLSQRGYTISKDKAIDAAKAAAMAHALHPALSIWIASQRTTASFPLIFIWQGRGSGTPKIRCTTRCFVRRSSVPLSGSMKLAVCSEPALFSKVVRTLESQSVLGFLLVLTG